MSAPAAVTPTFIPFTSSLYIEQFRPINFGIFVSFLLFGVTIMQFDTVFGLLRAQDSPSKVTWFLLIVLLIANVGETFAKILNFNDLVSGLAQHGVRVFFGKGPESVFGGIFMDGFIASLTLVFYIRRILNLIQKRRLGGQEVTGTRRAVTFTILLLACVFSLVGLAGSVWSGIITITRPIPEWLPTLFKPSSLWLGGAVVADIMLCGVFIFYLWQHRQNNSSSSTKTLVNRWIALTFKTSLTPCALQLVHLIIWFTDSKHGYHYAISFFIPKTYVVAVLVLYTEALQSTLMNSAKNSFKSPTSSGLAAHVRAPVTPRKARGSIGGVTVDTATVVRTESGGLAAPIELRKQESTDGASFIEEKDLSSKDLEKQGIL